MNLTIQLTPEDYIKANLVHMRPRPVIKWVGYFMLLLVVIVLGLSIYEAIAHQKSFSDSIWIIAALAYLAFLFGFLRPRRIRKIFRQQESLHMPYSFTVADDAVLTKSENGEARLAWDYFSKWKEGKDLFLLYQSDVMFHMVPKRCFASPEEMTQFRKLLLEKIGCARP